MTRTNSALQALSDSLTRVMTWISPEHYYRLCHVNAMLTSYALSKLMSVDWVVCAGSMHMRLTPEGEPPEYGGFDSSLIDQVITQDGQEFHEFHCWAMLTDLPRGTAVDESNQSRVILADFSALFWDTLWAAHNDAIRRPYPKPLIGHPIDLMRADIHYQINPACMGKVLADNLEAAAEAARLWDAIHGHYGLDQGGTGVVLMREILERCQQVKFGALAEVGGAA